MLFFVCIFFRLFLLEAICDCAVSLQIFTLWCFLYKQSVVSVFVVIITTIIVSLQYVFCLTSVEMRISKLSMFCVFCFISKYLSLLWASIVLLLVLNVKRQIRLSNLSSFSAIMSRFWGHTATIQATATELRHRFRSLSLC